MEEVLYTQHALGVEGGTTAPSLRVEMHAVAVPGVAEAPQRLTLLDPPVADVDLGEVPGEELQPPRLAQEHPEAVATTPEVRSVGRHHLAGTRGQEGRRVVLPAGASQVDTVVVLWRDATRTVVAGDLPARGESQDEGRPRCAQLAAAQVSGMPPSSTAQVSGPTMPSGVTPRRRW